MEKGKYVKVNNQKLHFYVIGEGPVLIMLHPSPSSGETLLPLARHLSTQYTVFCIDTPGYGKSEALAEIPKSLSDYTKLLHQAFEKLGLEKASIYGSATGAQLAVRYGLEYPESIEHIFLDNSAHFDDALANEILEHYFPDLTPQIDGSHLTEIWTIVTRLFQYFPWCFNTEEHALNRPQMPDFVLQMVAMDYLKAGTNYDIAYKLAFQHERGQYVQQLKVPTTIFRWNNSIITKYVDQLLAFEFENHIQGFMIDGDAAERTEKMVDFINKKAAQLTNSKINQALMKESKAVKLNYKKSRDEAPMVKSNGKHLQDAWRELIQNNPNQSAEEIQTFLVDWYSKN